MGVKNFNFALKFLLNGGFSPEVSVFERKCSRRKLADWLKNIFQGAGNCQVLFSIVICVACRKHEWEKHGTCSMSMPSLNSELKYFTTGLKLSSTFDLLQYVFLCFRLQHAAGEFRYWRGFFILASNA